MEATFSYAKFRPVWIVAGGVASELGKLGAGVHKKTITIKSVANDLQRMRKVLRDCN